MEEKKRHLFSEGWTEVTLTWRQMFDWWVFSTTDSGLLLGHWREGGLFGAKGLILTLVPPVGTRWQFLRGCLPISNDLLTCWGSVISPLWLIKLKASRSRLRGDWGPTDRLCRTQFLSETPGVWSVFTDWDHNWSSVCSDSVSSPLWLIKLQLNTVVSEVQPDLQTKASGFTVCLWESSVQVWISDWRATWRTFGLIWFLRTINRLGSFVSTVWYFSKW